MFRSLVSRSMSRFGSFCTHLLIASRPVQPLQIQRLPSPKIVPNSQRNLLNHPQPRPARDAASPQHATREPRPSIWPDPGLLGLLLHGGHQDGLRSDFAAEGLSSLSDGCRLGYEEGSWGKRWVICRSVGGRLSILLNWASRRSSKLIMPISLITWALMSCTSPTRSIWPAKSSPTLKDRKWRFFGIRSVTKI